MSDHGTNFIGAHRELDKLFKHEAIANFCSSQFITWKHIPERAPHFGGLWESAVKSTKTHLKKVADTLNLTYEELSTVLCQIESCLNSRPLVPMLSMDGERPEALTPGHFITGRPLAAIPERDTVVKNISILRRWRLCQEMVRMFWKRWSSEYLTSLNRWYKWHHPQRNLQPGDVVILKEENPYVNEWSLGRIEETYPGKDGLVRVAKVKTKKGTYQRPITKMAILLD